ncbi:MAG: aminoacetone oxidase family FAD-binding enzyme [Gemmatimonadetes bacterium]|nr:aminoacetone oxidase family FAD-binding enzyme [Gemmatimonadota bacterium]
MTESPVPLPVAVIGAGAAGLMAALHAARAGASVVLLERTSDGGRKILISGGGRCNVLPAVERPGAFVTDSSARLLRRLLGAWPLAEQRAFFESDLGLPLSLEAESAKLFPRSGKARDVRDALLDAARAAGVRPWFGAAVTDAVPTGNGWTVHLEGAPPLIACAVVLATGGLSVPATGSDGFGLKLADRLGHTVHPTYPALTPLTADPPPHAHLAGISLEVTLRAPAARPRFTTTGGFLFTHRGWSGPTVLDASHLATRARLGLAEPDSARIRVAWTRLDRDAWTAELQSGPGTVARAVGRHLPDRLVEQLLAQAGIPADRTLAQLRRGERTALVEALCDTLLPWTGDEGYKKAEVTGGGVALSEMDPHTLESRLCRGLFLCGELLDAFGPIGGHNFQWAWSTGRAAGLGAATHAQRPPHA